MGLFAAVMTVDEMIEALTAWRDTARVPFEAGQALVFGYEGERIGLSIINPDTHMPVTFIPCSPPSYWRERHLPA